MDLLFKKYASPFMLIERYIQSGCFLEFVVHFINIYYEEKNEKEMWDLYLFSLSFTEKSFIDFKNSLIEKQRSKEMSKQELKATIINSRNTLNKFKPS